MDLPNHGGNDRQLSISELQGDPLHYVLEYLDTKSLCNAVQVRKLWFRGVQVGSLQICMTFLRFAGLQKLARCRFVKTHCLLASQCSKGLFELIVLLIGCDDDLWRNMASRVWPQSTLRLSPFYQTYQVLLI